MRTIAVLAVICCLGFSAYGIVSFGPLALPETGTPATPGAGASLFADAADGLVRSVGQDGNVRGWGGYSLSWGGALNTAGKYYNAGGRGIDGELTQFNTGINDWAVPLAGQVTQLAWTSNSADETTVLKVWLNASGSTSVTLTGGIGVVAVTPISVVAADRLMIEYDAGTAPGASVVQLWVDTP